MERAIGLSSSLSIFVEQTYIKQLFVLTIKGKRFVSINLLNATLYFFLIMFSALFSISLLGCAKPVVSSITPIRLDQSQFIIDNKPCLTLTGLPYFLPKSIVTIDIKWDKDQYNWVTTISDVIQPDEKARFILKRNPNALYDDDITFAIDQNGLLQTLNTSTTGRGVSVIADVIGAVGNVFTFGAGVTPTSLKALPKGIPAAPSIIPVHCVFHKEYDPFSTEKKQSISLVSPPLGDGQPQDQPTFKVTIEPLVTNKIPTASSDKTENGIIVRLPIPIKITIARESTSEQYSSTLLLPDVRQEFIFPVNRRHLVTDQTKITLKDGMIQTVQQIRPSMVAGVIGIPKSIQVH